MRISDWSSDVCSSDLQPVDAIHTGEIDQRGRGLFLPLRQRQCLARLETEVPAAIADPGRARQHRIQGRGGLHQCIQRSDAHTSELQSLMRISYAVLYLKKKQPPINLRKYSQLQQ